MSNESVFGFEDFEKELEQYIERSDHVIDKVAESATKIKNRAVQIAKLKGLDVTHKGVDGIVTERQSDKVFIGWAKRPNFHLYFHETGWMAGKPVQSKTRSVNGKRRTVRTYGKGARFIAARPHMRPAFDELVDKEMGKIKKYIEER